VATKPKPDKPKPEPVATKPKPDKPKKPKTPKERKWGETLDPLKEE
jgi:hypothetical protein